MAPIRQAKNIKVLTSDTYRNIRLTRTRSSSSRCADMLWDLADQLEPEDGKLWVYDIDGVEIPAFTADGIEALREIIKDQIDRAG